MQLIYKFISVLLLVFPICSPAQTFIGSGGSIPDNGPEVSFPININSLPANVDSLFGVETICINITHPYDADLIIKLVAPDSTEVLLVNSNGGSADNFTNTCFNNSATTNIANGNSPFTGIYKSVENLGVVNNGQSANGTWSLKVQDIGALDVGAVISWSITFGNAPAVNFTLSVSNLPIVVINTNGQTIVDSPSKIVHFGIVNNANHINHTTDAFNDYDAYASIQIRGSSSQQFPKKSYGLSLSDALGNQIDSVVMGMPIEHDFILSANYTDKTFLRNPLAYTLWDKSGHYGTRYQHCEVVINGVYKGLYVFTEKIKRDKKRVNIAKLDNDDNAGDSITGGYIIKIDKTTGQGGNGFTSQYPPTANTNGQTTYYQFDYPSDINITIPQQNYIHAYVDSFEFAMHSNNFMDNTVGWRKYADEDNFMDYMLVNELSKNVDGYRLSTYFHKNINSSNSGGKLKAGPVWDYDIAFGNADYCEGGDTTGWAYNFGSVCGTDGYQLAFYWTKLMTDTLFTTKMKCRWDEVKQTDFAISNINNYLDSMVTLLTPAMQRNFATWPILGTYVWPNNYVGNSVSDEIDYLKNFIASRYRYLDANIVGNCNLVHMNEINKSINSKIYPTVFHDIISIENVVDIIIKNVVGGIVMHQKIYSSNFNLNLQHLSAGIYFLSCTTQNGKVQTQKIIKE